MNFKEVLEGRRSVRRYSDRPVSRDTILSLLEAAETAPSAGNLRAREYYVVISPELRSALSVAAFGQEHLAAAPVVVVVCADPARSGTRYGDRGQLYSIQDAAAATTCLLLAARDLGLGSCWTGAFDEMVARDLLNLPRRLVPTAMVSIGWPDERPAPPPGRDMTEAVHWIE
ncbi:nitroreductase family protein [Methanocrinis sp.]|uniref:nitroreductase family protein n=1 Tax=Methanocrinis sp. TaxID=3101522 RepID=UPI003D12E805